MFKLAGPNVCGCTVYKILGKVVNKGENFLSLVCGCLDFDSKNRQIIVSTLFDFWSILFKDFGLDRVGLFLLRSNPLTIKG